MLGLRSTYKTDGWRIAELLREIESFSGVIFGTFRSSHANLSRQGRASGDWTDWHLVCHRVSSQFTYTRIIFLWLSILAVYFLPSENRHCFRSDICHIANSLICLLLLVWLTKEMLCAQASKSAASNWLPLPNTAILSSVSSHSLPILALLLSAITLLTGCHHE